MEEKCIISEKRLSVQIKANEAGFYLVGKPLGVITGQNIVACVARVSARVRRQRRGEREFPLLSSHFFHFFV